MKTRKFEVNETNDSEPAIVAYLPFYWNSKKAISENSISGMFINNAVIDDKLITGLVGEASRLMMAYWLFSTQSTLDKRINIVPLRVEYDDTEKADIHRMSLINMDKLSDKMKAQVFELFREWPNCPENDAALADKEISELVSENTDFIYYLFHRLEKLTAARYTCFTIDLVESTARAITFRTDRFNVVAKCTPAPSTGDCVYV